MKRLFIVTWRKGDELDHRVEMVTENSIEQRLEELVYNKEVTDVAYQVIEQFITVKKKGLIH